MRKVSHCNREGVGISSTPTTTTNALSINSVGRISVGDYMSGICNLDCTTSISATSIPSHSNRRQNIFCGITSAILQRIKIDAKSQTSTSIATATAQALGQYTISRVTQCSDQAVIVNSDATSQIVCSTICGTASATSNGYIQIEG